MSGGRGRVGGAAPATLLGSPGGGLAAGIPAARRRKLYYSMKHRTQLYLDDRQYRWLRDRAAGGSIAGVVRDLIDAERARSADPGSDPLLRYLAREPAAEGRAATSVSDLDRDLYGG